VDNACTSTVKISDLLWIRSAKICASTQKIAPRNA
jgi:hypothetical protein